MGCNPTEACRAHSHGVGGHSPSMGGRCWRMDEMRRVAGWHSRMPLHARIMGNPINPYVILYHYLPYHCTDCRCARLWWRRRHGHLDRPRLFRGVPGAVSYLAGLRAPPAGGLRAGLFGPLPAFQDLERRGRGVLRGWTKLALVVSDLAMRGGIYDLRFVIYDFPEGGGGRRDDGETGVVRFAAEEPRCRGGGGGEFAMVDGC